MVSTGALPGDGDVQVRGVFEGGPGSSTQDLWVTLDRKGPSARNAMAPIGPGSVDLLTGNFELQSTDVSIAAYKTDLSVTRTYSSREKGWSVLGPGWTLGVPMEQTSAQYDSLVNLAEDAPEPLPYVIVVGSFGEEIVFSEGGAGHVAEEGYETLQLRRVMSSTEPGKVSRFELKDTQSNEVVTVTGSGTYRPSSVKLAGDGSVSYVYDATVWDSPLPPLHSRQVLSRMIAPEPAGVDCSGTLVRGCRALDFFYDGENDAFPDRLVEIRFTAWDPETAAMKTTTVARYTYDGARRLNTFDDPRRTAIWEVALEYDGEDRWISSSDWTRWPFPALIRAASVTPTSHTSSDRPSPGSRSCSRPRSAPRR